MNVETKVARFLNNNPHAINIHPDIRVILMSFNNFVSERCAHPYIIEDFCRILTIKIEDTPMVKTLTDYLNFMNSPEGQYEFWDKINSFLIINPELRSSIDDAEMTLECFSAFIEFDENKYDDPVKAFCEKSRVLIFEEEEEMLRHYWRLHYTPGTVVIHEESYKVWRCLKCRTKQFLKNQQDADTVNCKVCGAIFNAI